MTAEVIYQGDLRTQATHHLSGQTITTDAPPDNQGKGEAFSPTDLCATSLASCLLTIMGIRARDEGIDMQGARIALQTSRSAEPPRKLDRIVMDLYMPAKNWTAAEKAILTEASRSCPVCRSLSSELQTSLTIHWP
jgi:putative redox protein